MSVINGLLFTSIMALRPIFVRLSNNASLCDARVMAVHGMDTTCFTKKKSMH